MGDFLFLCDPIRAGILSLATFGLVIFFLFHTRWGLATRATSEDQAKAMAFGELIILFIILWPEDLVRTWVRIRDYFWIWPLPYISL